MNGWWLTFYFLFNFIQQSFLFWKKFYFIKSKRVKTDFHWNFHLLSFWLSSPFRLSNCIKFDSESLWPLKVRPCLARYCTLEISIFNLSRATYLSCLWAVLKSSPTSFVVEGEVTTASTASRCVFDSLCFLKRLLCPFNYRILYCLH